MEESSPFTKKHVEEVTAAKRTLLDELNLPPHVKQFIQDNSRLLLLGFVAIVAAICGWNYYTYYIDSRNDQAAKQLSLAMQVPQIEERITALEKVANDYAATGSGLWSTFALANIYLGQQDYDSALPLLHNINSEVPTDNPLYPLLQQFTGVAYELSGDLDTALLHYQILSTLPGFASLGYIAEGRVFERQDQDAKAKDAYEKALATNDIKAEQRAWLKEKMSSL